MCDKNQCWFSWPPTQWCWLLILIHPLCNDNYLSWSGEQQSVDVYWSCSQIFDESRNIVSTLKSFYFCNIVMNDRLFRKRWLDNIILWILQESEFQLVDNSPRQLFWVSARFAATQTRLEQLYMQVGKLKMRRHKDLLCTIMICSSCNILWLAKYLRKHSQLGVGTICQQPAEWV